MRIVRPCISHGVCPHHGTLAPLGRTGTRTLQGSPNDPVVAGPASEDGRPEGSRVLKVDVLVLVTVGTFRHVHISKAPALVSAEVPQLPERCPAMRAPRSPRDVF